MTGSAVSSYELEELIERATSSSIPNGELDLHVALEISDIVRSKRISHKESMRCLKKRIITTYSNPNIQLSIWKLTDICIKNGGVGLIKEVCSREFMDTMESTVLKPELDSEVKEIVIKLLYELYVTFKNDSQLGYVSKVYDKLKARGIEFPEHLYDPNTTATLFDSKTPADWIDSDACMICSNKFSLLNRRHHCRSCGGIFCQDHSSHNISLPDLGIYDMVRVCDNCFDDYDIKKSSSNSKTKKSRHKKDKKKLGSSGDFDEEEQIKRAIELSLRESQHSNQFNSTTEPVIPIVGPIIDSDKIDNDGVENDPDLKAAIEASLKEAELEKNMRLKQEQQRQPDYYDTSSVPQASIQSQIPYPDLDITADEENNIYHFAFLVEKMKSKSPSEILDDQQLQHLYQKVIQSRPKLNNILNDTVHKYNTLIEMNGKISNIMNLYDELLEKQLNSINISQRYSAPAVPSDPYAYYSLQQNQKPQEMVQTRAQEVQQPVQRLSQQPAQTQQHQTLNSLGDIITNSPIPAQTSTSPYPIQDTESLSDNNLELAPSEPPYNESEISPVGAEIKESHPIEEREPFSPNVTTQDPNITQYNFPTVPAAKITELAQEPEVLKEESQEEELLLEL